MTDSANEEAFAQPDLSARLEAIYVFLKLTNFHVSHITLARAVNGYAQAHSLSPLEAACEVEARLSESSLAGRDLVEYAG
ncbi:hypothetical protein [uncultured Pseudacidovorax sp.]|uniref:hypothetical protein n=1 Tax=uncultured Pseudacidovorax sp. TaxID=679313 RepID=UPI0025FB1DCA|nr:hypothetical protein [uncultured Pseudacidovorax sp.]